MTDVLKKYLFEDRSVRIEIVRLTDTWLAAQAHHDYPQAVASLLGELVAAAVLLATNLKFDGSLLLQMQGDGAIALMVAECRADLSVRATVKLRDQQLPDSGDLQALLNPHGGARFIVVLDPPKNTPGRQAYQGIVPLEGDSISEALEQYMIRSEQLHTKIWLSADRQKCAGLLLQKMPIKGGNTLASEETAEQSWERATALSNTLTNQELLETQQDTIIHRLFWEETLLGFDAQPITWKCSCTRERVIDMLKMLGQTEVDDILTEQGKIEVACEFCGMPYLFDAIDATSLFQTVTIADNKTLH